MIEETIRDHAIGEKIRMLRKEKKMGLVELGRHSGLSAALLSKVETGKLIPPLPTLLRIAMVFSVGLGHFFADDQEKRVVLLGRRGPDPLGDLLAGATGKLKAAIHMLGPEGTELCDATSGTGVLYVLSGQIRASVGENTWTADAGDCVTFSLHLSRAFWGMGNGARALFLTVL